MRVRIVSKEGGGDGKAGQGWEGTSGEGWGKG